MDKGIEAHWRETLKRGAVVGKKNTLAFAEFSLDKVSRTFALNIRVLPDQLRLEVMVAYLFCRMADTIEDAPDLPEAEKVSLLKGFSNLFEEKDPGLEPWSGRVQAFVACLPSAWTASESWEHILLRQAEPIFSLYFEFGTPVRASVAKCVQEMCSGMGEFTLRQAKTRDGKPLIASLEDLDSYCYYVAGTVGLLLCDLFSHHSGLIHSVKAKALKALAVSFGLGLQLTNILKDLHEDRERQVSFLPQTLLDEARLSPEGFLNPNQQQAAGQVWKRLLRKAKAHLEDAMEYSCLLPKLEPRMRLFCLWPLFMAAETLVMLAETREALQEGSHLKISRDSVKRIIRDTSMRCWSNRLLRASFRRPMNRLETLLSAPNA
jgi:farnesyl-diphosphate farnesyltransferase